VRHDTTCPCVYSCVSLLHPCNLRLSLTQHFLSSLVGNDVAVLQLDRSAALPEQVAFVNGDALWPKETDKLFAAGFGLTSDTQLAGELQGVVLDYVPNCFWREPSYNPTYNICGDSSPTKGTCAGDSGSPIMLVNPDGTVSSIILGLNSYSDGGCTSQTIDVYTRASTYQIWIYQQVCAISVSRPTELCDQIAAAGCLFWSFQSFRNAFDTFARYFGY